MPVRGQPFRWPILTAQVTIDGWLDFKPGMTVLAPGIGGSVGNATYQLAQGRTAPAKVDFDGRQRARKSAKAAPEHWLRRTWFDLSAEGPRRGAVSAG